MKKLRHKFTEWYVKRGYTFIYNKFQPTEATYDCPWWVTPLLIFFSPSVYYILVYGNLAVDNFNKGLEAETKRKEKK